MKRRIAARRGYAILLVLAFLLLFLSLLGVAYQQTAAALRIHTVRLQQTVRDEGSLHALARGLTLLETGVPPGSPYVCGVTVETTTGTRSYTVTFTSEGGTNWSVGVVPTPEGQQPQAMPTIFLP